MRKWLSAKHRLSIFACSSISIGKIITTQSVEIFEILGLNGVMMVKNSGVTVFISRGSNVDFINSMVNVGVCLLWKRVYWIMACSWRLSPRFLWHTLLRSTWLQFLYPFLNMFTTLWYLWYFTGLWPPIIFIWWSFINLFSFLMHIFVHFS